MIIPLLLIFIACTAGSLLLCGIAKTFFPKFCSGEHKVGAHRSDIRPDLPAGGREIRTYELPLVGGPAIILAIIGAGIGAGYLLNFSSEQWTLLLLALAAACGYMFVGFIDDWKKVYSNAGLSEKQKAGGVVFISMTIAALYFFLLPNSGREPYSLWKDLPILSSLLTHLLTTHHNGTTTHIVSLTTGPVAYFTWLIFLMLLTAFFGSLTSLSVDFSDGLDGLAGGLVFSASLAFGIVVAGLLSTPEGVVVEVLSLLAAAGSLGFLPWNWPSAWAARRGLAPRRAKIIMGDSGALGLGGLLAIIAIFSRNEILLPMIGGAFVLEGLSALIQTRILTRFFRRHLQILRFSNSREFVLHTEFPLPFLATPLHQHFDLLGWNRRRLVYGAWALGACFAILGATISLVAFPWQRYVVRILVLILAAAVWSSGSWSKSYFVGKHPSERSRQQRLALYYGSPYRIIGLRLYHLVEIIEASEDVIETPAEELALWQRMSIFDARAMLGLYCYRAGYYPAALAQWTRIPERNRLLRPEIVRLLAEVDSRLALEKQETQPMKRDDILRQQAIFSRKMSPADLPNPHEPIRNEEMGNGKDKIWKAPNHQDEDDDEEGHITTSPLHSGTSVIASNGHTTTTSPDSSATAIPAETLHDSTSQQSWLTRMLHFPPK